MIKEKYRANIVAHWDFRKGSLADQSGNGWDATLTGTPSFGRQKGRTLKIDADTEGLSLGKILGAAATVANMTVVVSTTPGTISATNRVIKKFAGAGSPAGSIDMDYLNTGVARFLVATSGDSWKISSTSAGAVELGKEVVLGGVFNGTAQTVQVFTNGVAGASTAFTESVIPLYDYAWELAYEGTSTGWGDYSQAIVFNVALTNAEMAQLYEEMRQEAHYDSVDIKQLSNPARTLVADGDMEAAGTTDWTAVNNAALTKQTTTPHGGTRCLRVEKNGSNFPYARQAILTLGKTYRITGWARSDGTVPSVKIFAGNLNKPAGTLTLASGSAWTYFDYVRTAEYDSYVALLTNTNGADGEYCEFDDVKVQEVPNTDNVYIADGKGWNESVANVTAGYLENTDWNVLSGTWQASDSKQKYASNDLVTNGGFDSDTGWTKAAGWTITGGTANFAATGSPANLNQIAGIAPWKTYEIIYTISNYSAGNIKCTPGGYVYSVNRSANGTYREIVTASNASSNTQIYFTADATFTGSIDNVIVREIKADGRKQITNVAAGYLARPSNQAYGTWEFDIYKTSDAGVAVVTLATNSTAALGSTNSYYFNFTSAEKFELYRDSSGVVLLQQSSGTFNLNNWYRIRITRSGNTWVMYHSTDGGQTYTATPLGYSIADAAPHTTSSFSYLWANVAGPLYRNFKFIPYIE